MCWWRQQGAPRQSCTTGLRARMSCTRSARPRKLRAQSCSWPPTPPASSAACTSPSLAPRRCRHMPASPHLFVMALTAGLSQAAVSSLALSLPSCVLSCFACNHGMHSVVSLLKEVHSKRTVCDECLMQLNDECSVLFKKATWA